jgi:flagellar biosynthetic protein FliR
MLPLANTVSGIPGLPLTEVVEVALQFMFAMLRVGAFIVAAPFFGARYIMLPIRVITGVFLGIVVYSNFDMPPVEQLVKLSAVGMVLTEIAIGLIPALLLTILFGAASVAGDRIASTAGLGFAAQIDPASGTNAPVVSQIFSLFLLGLFVATDGHLVAVELVIKTYETIPAGAGFQAGPALSAGQEAAAMMFQMSTQIMMPIVTILLLVNVLIGVITRSAPQMNIFSFGFPMTLTATVVLLFFNAPALAVAFEHLTDEALVLLRDTLREMANGRG